MRIFEKRIKLLKVFISSCFLFMIPVIGHGSQGVMLSDLELGSLPEYCKAAFQMTTYSDRLPPKYHLSSDVTISQRKRLATMGLPGAHHFCAGLAEMNRASRGRGQYVIAINEFQYSYSRTTKQSTMRSYIAANYGKALWAAGKKKEAIDMWQDAIEVQPEKKESYLAYVDILLRTKKHNDALSLLLKLDENKEYDSADVEFYLAHVYNELGDFELALKHAEIANDLGYPFTSLRDRLRSRNNK